MSLIMIFPFQAEKFLFLDCLKAMVSINRKLPQLTVDALDRLPDSIARPKFLPTELSAGIVHLGCGSFHRAHQALITQHAMNESGDFRWGIVGVAMKRRTIVDALRSQDSLYSLLLRDSDNIHVEVVGSISETVHAPSDPIGVPERIAHTRIKLVTLTVTAGGYGISPVSGCLDPDNEQIRNDLGHPARPMGPVGMIVRGMDLVRRRGGCPPVVISCDNLGNNGRSLRRAVIDFAALHDDKLADWISRNVQFPSSVVDRIVVPTTAADLAIARQCLGGFEDRAPVTAEPFMTWTIEEFDGERPQWERVGAQFVSDATEYELGKLRLLNGTHMLLAYVGALAGHRTIAEASSDPIIGAAARQFMLTEQGRTLNLPHAELRRTTDDLMCRFRNPSICHNVTRVGRNGSFKMSPRVIDAMCENILANRPISGAILLVASWIRGFVICDGPGTIVELIDPQRDSLGEVARAFAGDTDRLAEEFLSRTDIFGVIPSRDMVYKQLASTLAELARDDVSTVVRRRLLPEFSGSAI